MSNEIPVVISGLGHCSALGQGTDSMRMAWLDGATTQPSIETVMTAKGAVAVPVLRVPPINFPKLVPEAVERRMSRFSKICFVTLAEALADAGKREDEDTQRVGLIVGTAFGSLNLALTYQNRIFKDGASGASPSLFAASIHNSLASQLTLAFGIRGPNSTVSTMEQTAISSLRLAYDWIQDGIVDRVAVAVGDELSEYHLYHLAHAQCPNYAGEGMVSFVVEREDLARKKYARMNAPDLVGENKIKSVKIFSAKEHAHLYGHMVASAGFEIALAALSVERDASSVTCKQASSQLSHQSVELTSPLS
ncbi:MAG: beta-ketoacyl synthase N-terminal-like domain-containing protein [Bdellovibrionales bacterium]